MFKLGCLNISTFLFHSSKSKVWNLVSLASNSSDFSVWGYVPYRGPTRLSGRWCIHIWKVLRGQPQIWPMSHVWPTTYFCTVCERKKFEMVEKKIKRTIFQGTLHKIQIQLFIKFYCNIDSSVIVYGYSIVSGYVTMAELSSCERSYSTQSQKYSLQLSHVEYVEY